MSGDLVAFLKARLDEDEAAAGLGIPTGAWHARMLREVAAKRAILALHAAGPGQHPDFCGHDLHELPCPTLRLVAAVYGDHPDYQQEWADHGLTSPPEL